MALLVNKTNARPLVLSTSSSIFVRHASSTEIPDTTSGFRAYNREAALQMQAVSQLVTSGYVQADQYPAMDEMLGLPPRDLAILATLHEAVGGFTFAETDRAAGALAVAVASGLFGSAGEARRAIAQGGLSINDERMAAADSPVPEPIADEWLLVRFGKRRLVVGRRAG